jgi:uncharacterized protein (TIGR02246 family)
MQLYTNDAMNQSEPSPHPLPDGLPALLDDIRQAWDAGDADAYARLFTEDASYVIYTGAAYCGRAAIRDSHLPVFTRWQKGSRMAMRVLQWHRVGDDVVVVLTEGGVGRGRTIRHDKLQTFTMRRTPQGWRCAAFQNTRKSRWFGWLMRVAAAPRHRA